MTNTSTKTILIAPLDWGLGHATRCIPIIQSLQTQGHQIIVAVNKKQQHLLEKELNQIQFIFLEGYQITYSKSRYFFVIKILAQIPKILYKIYNEHQWLKKLIQEEKIDMVITDNRFGLFSKKVPCIFITHQLEIQAPFEWMRAIIQKINYAFINKFQQCWIPDIDGENNMAGGLSHPKKLPQIPTHYLGNLSRFKIQTNAIEKYDVCVLLSGPEPQRTLLEEKLIHQISLLKSKKIIFLRGLPETEKSISITGVEVYNHLQHHKLETVLNQSECIVSRSGYTSVMELLSLQKKAILIPTPGQTEQEYLAAYLLKKKIALSYTQNVFDMNEALKEAANFNYQRNVNVQFNSNKLLELINNILP